MSFKHALLIAGMALSLSAPSFAAMHEGSHEKCFASDAELQSLRYNPADFTVVRGVIKSIDQVTPDMNSNVYLTVSTDRGDVVVVLGPANVVNASNMQLKSGDTVEAAGSEVYWNDRTVIIATELRKNGMEMELRDVEGRPFFQE